MPGSSRVLVGEIQVCVHRLNYPDASSEPSKPDLEDGHFCAMLSLLEP